MTGGVHGCVGAVQRRRKSKFVRLFDKTPEGVYCPHFYELILSNGCPYQCSYCYLQLTFRGSKHPQLFTNDWMEVEKELDAAPGGVFSTGELADSLACIPPLLAPALDYFEGLKDKFILLVTKSVNLESLLDREPSDQAIISFSVNSVAAWRAFEKGTPDPGARLEQAAELRRRGWRVRIRLDPVIVEAGLDGYKGICTRVSELKPERITVGSLRQYPGLMRFSPKAPRQDLKKAPDGRLRYPLDTRKMMYEEISHWLGERPALCKETHELWDCLDWSPDGCNCTP
jgi:spore photoproduct lyase